MNDIKDALSRVADSAAPAPLTLDHVRGRARRIRRRRAMTAIAGTAAAVAAIAGLGVATLPSGSQDDGRPPIAHTPTAPVSPTRTADAVVVGPVHRVRLDVPAEQTFGGEPQVPYWADGRIIDSDGTATPLPDRPLAFARDTERGGWVVIRQGEALGELVRITRDGKVTNGPLPTFPDGLAVGPQGQLATVTQETGGWWLRAGGRRLSLGGSVDWAALEGFRARGDVVVQVNGAVEVADVFSGRITALPGASAAVPSPVLPLTAVGRGDGTWVAQREDGVAQWSLDWAGVSSFSPDGRYVALSGDPKHRIRGSADWDSDHATGTLWIRTASDLLPVAAFTAPANAYFWSWTWDGDQLLATVYSRDTRQWSLVWLSADGFQVGRATGRPGGGEQPAYVFATQ